MRPGAVGRWQSYLPTPRQAQFHAVPAYAQSGRLIKGFVGGLGGGKSTACENELVELCQRFPGGTSISVRKSMTGRVELWIEAGQPEDRRVRKACVLTQRRCVERRSLALRAWGRTATS